MARTLITGKCFCTLHSAPLLIDADVPLHSITLHSRLRYSLHDSSFALTGGGNESLFQQTAAYHRFILLGHVDSIN